MASKIITNELKEEIIKFYKSKPMGYKDIEKKYNLSTPTIMKILNGIEKYSKSIIFNPELKEDFFESIDDEYKAYFIGLLISDGNVFIDGNKKANRQASISITLDNNDKYILEDFKKIIKTNTKISSDGRGCCQIAVRSNKMYEDLSKYGIIPNKSFKTYLPKLNNEMMPHLIRGILDGDGCINSHLIKSGRFLHSISFCGSKQLMNDISDFLFENLKLKTKPKVYTYKDRNLSEISIRNINDMFIVGKYLYSNATIFLKRKYNKFNNFIEHYNLK